MIDKIHKIATVASLVCIPIIIAIVGWSVQTSISEQSIQKDYVLLAVEILRTPAKKENEELKSWAVDVLQKYSPVPLSRAAKNTLVSESLNLCPRLPEPPASLLEPISGFEALGSKNAEQK